MKSEYASGADIFSKLESRRENVIIGTDDRTRETNF